MRSALRLIPEIAPLVVAEVPAWSLVPAVLRAVEPEDDLIPVRPPRRSGPDRPGRYVGGKWRVDR